MSGLPQYRVVVQALEFDTLPSGEVTADVQIRFCFRELGSMRGGCRLGRVNLDSINNTSSLLLVDLRGNPDDLSPAYPSGFLMNVRVTDVLSGNESEVNVNVSAAPGELVTVSPVEPVTIDNTSVNFTATVGIICSINYTGPQCNTSMIETTESIATESTTTIDDPSSTENPTTTEELLTTTEPKGLLEYQTTSNCILT